MVPLVTVVVPAYNSERFIAEAVRSALNQDYPAKEILVINDGSTDGTLEELALFADSIRVLTVKNSGPAAARNLGMRLAQGEFIAFLDADDVWASGKLSAQVRHLQAKPDTGVCYTAWQLWPADRAGQWTRPTDFSDALGEAAALPKRSGWIYGDLLLDCELLTTTVMLRTEVARRAGEFDEELRVGEDYDYWLRLSQMTRIDRLNCCGALYRVVPGSESRRPHLLNHELIVVRRALDRFGLNGPSGVAVPAQRIEQRLHELSFQHSWAHLKSGDPEVALRGFLACLRERPWSLRLWVRCLQAFGASRFAEKRYATR
jgi:glycosyltransferase involved in cell wall biosynthesis